MKKLREENIKTALLYLALLQPILLHTQVEVVLHTSSLHYFLFILLLSLLFKSGATSVNVNISVAAKKNLTYANIVFFIVAQVFLIHSISANRDLVAYYKQMQPLKRYLLQKPLQNPYFADIATWLLMRELLYTSITNNDLDGLQQAIDWTENELQQNPNVELYFRLINAHAHRNEKNIACDYVKKASAMFPDEGQLIKFQEKCYL
jgi:O-antigen ligase/polysaccharide polymerase Wzy-like membrane protein